MLRIFWGLILVSLAFGHTWANQVKSVSTGNDHSCAIMSDHKVWCWGSNLSGQLGAGYYMVSSLATQIPSFGHSTQSFELYLGCKRSCLVTSEGKLKCWGARGSCGSMSSIGYGNSRTETLSQLSYLDLDRPVKKVSPQDYTCVLFADGEVQCVISGLWPTTQVKKLKTIALPEPAKDLSVGTYYNRACAVGESGRVWCWALNAAPEEVKLGTAVKAQSISAGSEHHCIVSQKGRIKCWGRNLHGRLGLGINDTQYGLIAEQQGDNLPFVNLGDDIRALSVQCGALHCCSLLENHALKCWGHNAFGQLGYGDALNRGTLPEHMGERLPFVHLGTENSKIESLAVGAFHNCVSFTNGKAKCWGKNSIGEIGSGSDAKDIGTKPAQMGDYLKPIDFLLKE